MQGLSFGPMAQEISNVNRSNKGFDIASLIQSQCEHGILSHLETTQVFPARGAPKFINEYGKYKAAMELVQEVVTSEQLSNLKKKDLSNEQLLQISTTIGRECKKHV
jgi:hypothetical protein